MLKRHHRSMVNDIKLPPHTLFKSVGTAFLEKRREALDAYLKALIRDDDVASSPYLLAFLASENAD